MSVHQFKRGKPLDRLGTVGGLYPANIRVMSQLMSRPTDVYTPTMSPYIRANVSFASILYRLDCPAAISNN